MPPQRSNATSSKSPQSTRDALIAAAAAQFNTEGFWGTDTNKIARAAGFSPQTFYRHFADKIDVFLAVYEQWQVSERAALARAARARVAEREIARVILDHHKEWRVFRRSLRMLAVKDEQVRRARALSRERQVAALAQLPGNAARSKIELVGALLRVERLCDAAADGELSDLGAKESEILKLVTAAVRDSRQSPT